MSQLLNQHSKLCLGKPVFARSSPLCSNGFSSSLQQTPPCTIMGVGPCDFINFGQLVIHNANEQFLTFTKKKVPRELMDKKTTVMIGSSHGWVATLNLKDKRLRLIDDLNPVASDTDPKRILLPPLETRCDWRQPQIVTNVAMSSPSPEEEDCIVAVKIWASQLSFCRPAQSNAEWFNIKIEDPCFNSSRVMFSKKDDMLRIPGLGGHLIGSWDLRTHNNNPKIQKLRFQNLPKAKRYLMHPCHTSEHLVESTTTGETFLVKWYRKWVHDIDRNILKLREEAFKTQALMVFKLDEEGNAVYTQDIGDLCIFLSNSEPFCVPASSFPGMFPNHVCIYDVHEHGYVDLADCSFTGGNATFKVPYHIPPQNID